MLRRWRASGRRVGRFRRGRESRSLLRGVSAADDRSFVCTCVAGAFWDDVAWDAVRACVFQVLACRMWTGLLSSVQLLCSSLVCCHFRLLHIPTPDINIIPTHITRTACPASSSSSNSSKRASKVRASLTLHASRPHSSPMQPPSVPPRVV